MKKQVGRCQVSDCRCLDLRIFAKTALLRPLPGDRADGAEGLEDRWLVDDLDVAETDEGGAGGWQRGFVEFLVVFMR